MFRKTLRMTPKSSQRVGSEGTNPPARLPALENIYVVGEKYRRQVDSRDVNEHGRTGLHRAVLQTLDSDASVVVALRAGCDIEAADKDGRRALHHAARRGHVRCVRRLIEFGAMLNAAGKDGLTPLMEAARRSQLEALKVLIAAGAGVNHRSTAAGETALHYAACGSEVESIHALARAKADLNAPDLRGNTALILAARLGEEKAIKALVSVKADVNRADVNGCTALHHAAMGNRVTCAELLMDKGALLDVADNSGDTPFVAAIRKNAVDVLDTLINAGCDRTAIDEMMGTSLALAAVLGHTAATASLLRAGEDPDESGYFGMTPLMLAICESHVETVELLLGNGADPNAHGRIGGSSLQAVLMHVSAINEFKRHQILAALIHAGAKINIVINGKGLFVGCTNGNNSPLSFAISSGYVSAVRMLLAAGSHVPLDEVLHWMKTTNLYQFYDVGPLTRVLCDWVSEPRSLKQICRGVIRGSIAAKRPLNVGACVESLPLARSLRRYVNFEELEYFEVEKAEILDGANPAMLDNLDTSPCGLRMIEGSIMHLINARRTNRMEDK